MELLKIFLFTIEILQLFLSRENGYCTYSSAFLIRGETVVFYIPNIELERKF